MIVTETLLKQNSFRWRIKNKVELILIF